MARIWTEPEIADAAERSRREGSAFGGVLCVLPGGFWTNRLKNSKIRSECARMLDSIL